MKEDIIQIEPGLIFAMDFNEYIPSSLLPPSPSPPSSPPILPLHLCLIICVKVVVYGLY
jgi:hypothetical protein